MTIHSYSNTDFKIGDKIHLGDFYYLVTQVKPLFWEHGMRIETTKIEYVK